MAFEASFKLPFTGLLLPEPSFRTVPPLATRQFPSPASIEGAERSVFLWLEQTLTSAVVEVWFRAGGLASAPWLLGGLFALEADVPSRGLVVPGASSVALRVLSGPSSGFVAAGFRFPSAEDDAPGPSGAGAGGPAATVSQGAPGAAPWPVSVAGGPSDSTMQQVRDRLPPSLTGGALRVHVENQIAMSEPMAVELVNAPSGPQAIEASQLPLPEGASTAARQDEQIAILASLDGKAPSLVGGNVPVTVAAPLPAGSNSIGAVSLSPAVFAGAPANARDFDTDPAATANAPLVGIALPGPGGPSIGGTVSAPVRTDPTGTTPQPVTGSVSVSALPGSPAQEHTAPSSPSAARLTDGFSFYAAAKAGDVMGADVRVGGAPVTAVNALPVAIQGAPAVSVTFPANPAQESGGNLASIAASAGRIPPQGQAAAAGSLPVVLPAAQAQALAQEQTLAALSAKLPASVGPRPAAASLSVASPADAPLRVHQTPIADATTDVWDRYQTSAAALAAVIKAGPGRLRYLRAVNATATPRFVTLHSLAAASGMATANMIGHGYYVAPAASGRNGEAIVNIPEELAFPAGIVWALSTDQVSFAAASGAGVHVSALYK